LLFHATSSQQERSCR